MNARDLLRAAQTGLLAARRELLSPPVPTPTPPAAGGGRPPGPSDRPPMRSPLMGFTRHRRAAGPGQPQSVFDDPMAGASGPQYRERPWASAFEQIRQVCYEGPYIGAIIKMRTNEVGMFTQPAKNRFETGYRIELRDPKERPTKASIKQAKALTRFVEHTGYAESSALRDRFPIYMSKVCQDSLMFSQDATEIVRDRKGRPAAFYAIDASTVRIAENTNLHSSDNVDDEVRYVQVIDGLITTQYRHKDIIFGIRNPTSDVHMNGYPVSEIELAMRAISAIIAAWKSNERAITKGANIRGIINIPQAMSQEHFEAFCENFQRFATGTDNAHGTNIMNCEGGFQYTNLAAGPMDLQWGEWFNLCLKVICSIYSVAPESINFQYGNAGGGPVLNQSSNEYKIVEAREKGLRPLLGHLFGSLNEGIIWGLDKHFHVVPVGLDAMTRDQLMAYNTSRIQTLYTLNEIRRENDLPDLPHGDSPLSPTYLQIKSMAEQKEMYAQQQAAAAQQQGQDPYADPQGGATQAQVPAQVGGQPAADDPTDTDGGKGGQQQSSDAAKPGAKTAQAAAPASAPPSTVPKPVAGAAQPR